MTVPRSGTASPTKLEASGSCTSLRDRTATTSRRRFTASGPAPLHRPGPYPSPPHSYREPPAAAQPTPRQQEPPAPVTAASITFMPPLPQHRPAGMEGGRPSPSAASPSPPALGLRLLLPDVNTHRREGGEAGPRR